MNEWTNMPNLLMNSAALLMILMGFFMVIILPSIDRWSKRFFTAFFSIIVLLFGTFLVDSIIYVYPSMALAERIIIYLESLLAALLMPMLTVHLLHCCGENWRRSPLMWAVGILWVAYFILLNVTQFTTFIYYVTPDNVYYRGPWYPLLLVPPAVTMILNLVAIIRRRDRLTKKYFWAFLICAVPLTATMLIQMVIYGLYFIGIGIALSALTMYALVLTDQIERYVQQQRELAHQRASIMVLQMRPHFIYNTMTSIYYLCQQDTEKAQSVILDFTTYLRKNFTAIASDHTIPFPEELEHTRAYLAVEQAQFEDDLFVDYDTPHTLFRVPPLTLQPIVENAVKHGMDPDSEPLHISIRTRKTDSGSEILVEDDGPGYDRADDSEPHIALPNIRERLELMCGGRLEISPRDGGGTVVRILVP